ncbi:hypothetical protein BH23VER1_BH23VER1_18840 [soil metagenome]
MPTPCPLEDEASDILSKARRGLGLPESATPADLGLDPGALDAVAHGRYRPEVAAPDGLAIFTTEWHDMRVNAYLVRDPQGGRCAVFDTGADAAPIRETVDARSLVVDALFLTHTHPDHVADLPGVRGAVIYAPQREPVPGAIPVCPGDTFQVGALTIVARPTPGHSPGGTTYLFTGLAVPVAVVGDALFAGSMGGAPDRYRDALRSVREQILTLPDETVLCPGHGPLTTVALEKKHNPFFAAP